MLCVKFNFALPKLFLVYRGLPKHSRYSDKFILIINLRFWNAGRVTYVVFDGITARINAMIDKNNHKSDNLRILKEQNKAHKYLLMPLSLHTVSVCTDNAVIKLMIMLTT